MWLSTNVSKPQPTASTFNPSGPFDRRSEQLYRRHRGGPPGGRVGSHTIYLPAFRISSKIPHTRSYRPERSACCPCHDSIISWSIFFERTARIALLSGLKGIGISSGGGTTPRFVPEGIEVHGCDPQFKRQTVRNSLAARLHCHYPSHASTPVPKQT
jgi:hypothetical protein